ncbi:CocE/NonD family hydrolase [Gordonia pseudamarae]|jgi:putative CocE/NonD family hydrolase|uniref:CocE/NonD family hydrolase n=1 Tax=Gordonia pseudamarae TaxID=2831662 RepID=A0ABX6ICI6_9ACTN|nr:MULTISPECIES: CocE/NonD family hydrolase [Gordonia]MBD0022884.1 CocE/NonD family hydrolase [Gordonia sp. (in: high G+C Gram-positive bacteria)]QHN24746.1 CocE/NonD family hydrolase [Gordonia pseudamarae]QHN33677.1 CocE/NonD family hydrolase [Gordonia pseudamarae]
MTRRRGERPKIGFRAAALATVSAVVVGLGGAGVATADPTGGPAGKQWTATHDGKQKYAGVSVRTDVPIRMSDGTVLRADIYRPADARQRPVDTRTPVIVNLTPYTKLLTSLGSAVIQHPVLEPFLDQVLSKVRLTGPLRGGDDLIGTIRDKGIKTMMVDDNLIRSGYTQVVVDVRGTGFSQGTWDVFRSREQMDTIEVINWAAAQKWSDGKIGMAGVSYSGINQIYAAKMAPKALKAIFPVEPGGDLIRDVVAPGGGLGVGFLPLWLTLVNATKLIPNVASMMNGTFDWKWLADRMSEPGTFYPQLLAALTVPDIASIPPNLKSLLDESSDERSSWLSGADKITVPTMIYGGWFDLFTNSEVRMFNRIPLPPNKKKLIMGDGYHITIGAGQFGKNGTPSRLDVLQRAWFDKWLKGIDNGIDEYGPVVLQNVGDNWITADQFPRAGMHRQRLYLSDRRSGTAPYAVRDGSLTTAKVNSRGRLTVSPGLATVCSRDSAQQTIGVVAVLPVCSDDARFSERDALTFTSAPVATTRSVSGYTNVRLNTVLDATDGYWVATLNDVAPDGTSKVLASGQLVASLRDYDAAKSEFAPNGDVIDPHLTMTLSARQPVTPGRPVTVDIGLLPTEAKIRAGHRLRVDVFAMNLPRGLPLRPLLNASQLRPQHIRLDPDRPSFVNLPISKPLG